MPPNPLVRLRKLCLVLPEATEVEAWGEPIGVWLDGPCDWKELASLLIDGYRLAAPRKLAAQLPPDGE